MGTYRATLALQPDGTLQYLLAETEEPLDDARVRDLKREKGESIREWLTREAAKINAEVEGVAEVHRSTPDPSERLAFVPERFLEPPPSAPVAVGLPWFLKPLKGMLKGRVQRLEDANEQNRRQHAMELQEYEQRAAAHRQAQARLKRLIEVERLEDPTRMADLLESRLSELEWPRETLISEEVSEDGSTVHIDVDLPEVEDMPTRSASVAAREFRLLTKELSATRVRQLYSGHVHAVIFRIIGEVFYTLPTVQRVVASGYSQRVDPASGQERDEYLLSVGVTRSEWQSIDFCRLSDVNPVEALARFELRRSMTKGGTFKAVEPW